MPSKKLSAEDRLKRFADKLAALPNKERLVEGQLNTLLPKAQAIIDLIQRNYETPQLQAMQCFICYDIENNKVRKYISDYLEREGCVRVQKSVFFANLATKIYDRLCRNLKEVNALYNNDDSIMVVPVYKESVRGMQVIGQEIDFHYIANKPEVVIL